jgi:DNA-binding NtrC family response regulator
MAARRFKLPAAELRLLPLIVFGEAKAMNRMQARRIHGAKVLVVEDEYFLADDLANALRSADAEPIGPVATLNRAKRCLARGGIDAAIIDMNLRGEIAGELADRIAKDRIPCIIVSGYSADAHSARIAALPWLEKPVDARLVIEALDAQLQMQASGAAG